ncbi:carboxylesterase family protein [Amycolatopsis sp. NPDC051061]|uniref:carboxylesterase/lipase family protein n=1 Tax=Amycolatopsis sp. NPDC051061 TaxID=3155042 RepID=UPI00342226E4
MTTRISLTTRVTGGLVRGAATPTGVVFHSIPYAAPPAGPRRFAPPAAAAPWTRVRDASAAGPSAPAPRRSFGTLDLTPILGTGRHTGDDYLTATVSTPDPHAGGLPVLVFVHGGGLTAGTGAAEVYDGRSFTRDGVVLVTLNYRLGVSGWLDVPDAPANRGLLDVLAGLRWVAENIASFGGDAARVTVAGQSAGAMIVAALLACPEAEGLFQRAISQSGSGDCAFERGQAAVATRGISSLLGRDATAASLSDLTDDQLIELATALPPLDHAAHGFLDTAVGASPFKPVIDGVLLTGQPADTLRPGLGTDLLIGSTADEANLYTVPNGLSETASEADLLAAARRRFPDPETRLDGYRELFPDKSPGQLLSRVITDAFTGGSRRLAAAHIARSQGHTFSYEFRWASSAYEGRLGACHGIELPFVFDRLDVRSLRGPRSLLGAGEPDFALAGETHEAWVRFVKTGHPGWAPNIWRLVGELDKPRR